MVARSAARAFCPEARPRIAISSDGAYAAVVMPARVVIVELPGGGVHAEVGLDTSAVCDVAWVGARLLVVARHAAYTTVHLVDIGTVEAPRSLAEIRLESPMRLAAAVGPYALVLGTTAAVLTAHEAHVLPHQFMSRAVPIAAGAAGSHFVVAMPGTVEEWDPTSRTPKRRLRLPRPSILTAVGGSERLVWMTTQLDPARIDVLPLVNRGQPKTHEMPEAVAAVHAHPRSDLIACTGAESGRLYVVDLDGRTRLRTIAAEGIDHVEAAGLVVGRMLGVVVAQTQRPLAIIPLDGREVESIAPLRAPEPAAEPPVRSRSPSLLSTRSSLYAEPEAEPEPAPEIPEPEPDPAASREPDRARDPEDETLEAKPPPPVVAEPERAPRPRTPWGAPSLTEKFSSLRERGQKKTPQRDPVLDVRASWRDDAVQWTRAILAGTFDKPPPLSPPIEALATRFELAPAIQPALVLLYGAHLAGHDGVPPADIARVLGRTWGEALGRGQLAALGLAGYERSRVILAAAVRRALDELPPAAGTLVGTPSAITLIGPSLVIAPDAEPLESVADRLVAALGGAILAARVATDPRELLLEARCRSAVPLVHATSLDLALATSPMILVVPDDDRAATFGFPIIS